MLVMLGFFAGGLVALLIAPTLWSRAVRLTTRRLEATMPMSLAEIEADKDLLRASYAVELRRLEAALDKAREKSASQLVEISKLQMEIGSLREQMAALTAQLDERSNAANVFEKTVRKRLPELDAQLAAAKAALEERGAEITELVGKLRRRDEALALAQQAAGQQQTEIHRLREGLEASGADRSGRFKKRPAQWTLEEFRSEYDRLNLELSKMRDQLALSQEREGGQAQALKSEMQQLAERIMTAVSAREKHATVPEKQERSAAKAPAASRGVAPRQQRGAHMPFAAPKPWPKDQYSQETSAEHSKGPSERQKLSSRSDKPSEQPAASVGEVSEQARDVGERMTEESDSVSAIDTGPSVEVSQPASADSPESESGPANNGGSRMSMNAPVTAGEADEAAKSESRAALKTLLDRTPAPVAKDESGRVPSLAAMFGAPDTRETAQEGDSAVPAGPDAIPAGVSLASLVAQAATSGGETSGGADGQSHDAASGTGAGAQAGQEAQMDRLLREVFESQSGAASSHKPSAAAAADAVLGTVADDTQAEEASHSQKAALLERLREMKERQTG